MVGMGVDSSFWETEEFFFYLRLTASFATPLVFLLVFSVIVWACMTIGLRSLRSLSRFINHHFARISIPYALSSLPVIVSMPAYVRCLSGKFNANVSNVHPPSWLCPSWAPL